MKDLTIHLPPGLVGNPLATTTCTEDQLNANACPAASDVGDVSNNVTLTVARARARSRRPSAATSTTSSRAPASPRASGSSWRRSPIPGSSGGVDPADHPAVRRGAATRAISGWTRSSTTCPNTAQILGHHRRRAHQFHLADALRARSERRRRASSAIRPRAAPTPSASTPTPTTPRPPRAPPRSTPSTARPSRSRRSSAPTSSRARRATPVEVSTTISQTIEEAGLQQRAGDAAEGARSASGALAPVLRRRRLPGGELPREHASSARPSPPRHCRHSR